jgi:hypothetical protein
MHGEMYSHAQAAPALSRWLDPANAVRRDYPVGLGGYVSGSSEPKFAKVQILELAKKN